MNPHPNPRSVLRWDNASVHHKGLIQRLCDERGIVLEYLASYSPDYNPEEKAFSPVKSYIRRHCVLENTNDVIEAIHDACWKIITPELMDKLYTSSGYYKN